MRDKRFIAEHRGGPLKKAQHFQLMNWACNCVEHLIYLTGITPDERIKEVILVARKWSEGNASVGDARKASLTAIAVANESSDPVRMAIARAAGHAVATAHMADHSLATAYYGLKAAKAAGKSIIEERAWQNHELSREIRELIISAREEKIDKFFKFEE